MTFNNGKLHMSLNCPKCSSDHVRKRNTAMKTGAVIGATGGAISGFSGALAGAEMGALAGALAGPVGIPIGGIGGAVFGALIVGTAGCITGSRIGGIVDQEVLDNYCCVNCDYTFNNRS
ncbi:hypothetical protein [Pseudomonas sp. W2-17]|uniref:hypothetical protein n=1 Tax=Pseudomonas sp. W2-17 TaxID=3058039 RepID=UPI0034E0BA59